MAGRANGLQVIDGPFLKIRELDALRDYAMRTRILGYDGKWSLHPDQVTVINEVYTPTQEQFDKAFDILEAYEKATTEGERRGAVMSSGCNSPWQKSPPVAPNITAPRRSPSVVAFSYASSRSNAWSNCSWVGV